MKKPAVETITWDDWVSLDVPRTWNIDEDDGIISLYPPNGGGMLQMSFLDRHAPTAPSPEEVAEMARRFGAGQGWQLPENAVETLTLGGCPAAVFEYMDVQQDEPAYWKVWHVIDDKRAVLLTYVAPDADDDEATRFDKLVASLHWQ